MALKVRRGSNAERQQIVFEQGELVYTTDTKKLYVGDGINQGGFPVTGDPFLGITELVEDLTPQLGGNLDLNGKTIFGNGQLTISGSATIEELSILNFATNLVPKLSNAYSLGNVNKRLKNVYTHNLNIDGRLDAEAIRSDIVGDDSTILVNSATSKILTTALTQSGATDGQALVWNALNGQWQPGTVSGGGGGGLTEIVLDTSPQLGGDLDLNGNNLVGTGNVSIVGEYELPSIVANTFNFTGEGNVTDTTRGISFNSRSALSNYGSADITLRINNEGDFTDVSFGSGITVNGDVDATNFNGNLIGNVVGNVTGDVTGNVIGNLTGDVSGNIIGDVIGLDSTLLVDSSSNILSNGVITLDEDFIKGSTAAATYDPSFSGFEPVVVVGSRITPATFAIEGNINPFYIKGTADAVQGVNVNIQAARYTGSTPDAVQNGDYLGQLVFEGYDGFGYKKAAILSSTVTSNINAGNFDTALSVSVLTAAGTYSNPFVFKPSGVFESAAINFTPAADAILGGFASLVTTGATGYGADKDTLIVYDGTNWQTVTTSVAVPSGPTAAGKAGQIAGDADYMYFCHSDDNWIRVAKDGTWT